MQTMKAKNLNTISGDRSIMTIKKRKKKETNKERIKNIMSRKDKCNPTTKQWVHPAFQLAKPICHPINLSPN